MERSDYNSGLNKVWWVPLLTGLIFIAFGVWFFCGEGYTQDVEAYIFAGAIGFVGLCNVFYGILNFNTNQGYGWALAGGVAEILLSVFVFCIPTHLLVDVFIYGSALYIILMTVYSFFDGVVVMSSGKGMVAIFSVLLIAAFGFACVVLFGMGGTDIDYRTWILLSFACYGAYRVLFAFRLRALNEEYRRLK